MNKTIVISEKAHTKLVDLSVDYGVTIKRIVEKLIEHLEKVSESERIDILLGKPGT